MSSLLLSTLFSASAAMAMDMDMHSDMGSTSSNSTSNACKISMLWNWNTIDACFISSSWQIRSNGMFAGSCIGVILLVMFLEFLRRASKEFDRWLLAQHIAAHAVSSSAATNKSGAAACVVPAGVPPFRPNVWQQGVRAFLHLCQFAAAYFVMLLAMYYNGYFIICIFIGAYLGAFLFQWETINIA
ncbi:hypothetical protein TD95_001097 [Thielaviopsis punctulata]|uniref:Copper transport protein n=1 Tax=Thielaviopsis punctulata TaxID=72032 RepID=A0A0F4ZL50_9PEZI|nr:hypothetical protein TD95_001097 [Thielaviopsis punctulata]